MHGPSNRLLVLLMLAVLAGCSQHNFLTGTSDTQFSNRELKWDVAEARILMRTAEDCCDSLAQLPYQPLEPGGKTYFRIDNDSPHFTFDDGKSRFLAFELPSDPTPFTLELRSLAIDSVFAPTALLLDENFQLVRRIGEESFRYIPAQWFSKDSVDTFLVLNPIKERYLVIYTTEWQQASETVLLHPAKVDARSRGVVPPTIPDPIARHAPVGTLYLSLEPGAISRLARWLEIGATGFTWASRRQGPPPPDALPEAVVLTDEAPAAAPTPFVSDEVASTLDAIRQAVADGRYDQALLLQEQAEREGINQAREVLLEALKKQQ